jgi:hypothetical protein
LVQSERFYREIRFFRVDNPVKTELIHERGPDPARGEATNLSGGGRGVLVNKKFRDELLGLGENRRQPKKVSCRKSGRKQKTLKTNEDKAQMEAITEITIEATAVRVKSREVKRPGKEME